MTEQKTPEGRWTCDECGGDNVDVAGYRKINDTVWTEDLGAELYCAGCEENGNNGSKARCTWMEPKPDDYILSSCGELGGRVAVKSGDHLLGIYSCVTEAAKAAKQQIERHAIPAKIWRIGDNGLGWEVYQCAN